MSAGGLWLLVGGGLGRWGKGTVYKETVRCCPVSFLNQVTGLVFLCLRFLFKKTTILSYVFTRKRVPFKEYSFLSVGGRFMAKRTKKKKLLLIRGLTISDFYETRLFSKPIKNKLLYKVSKHLTVNYKTLY